MRTGTWQVKETTIFKSFSNISRSADQHTGLGASADASVESFLRKSRPDSTESAPLTAADIRRGSWDRRVRRRMDVVQR